MAEAATTVGVLDASAVVKIVVPEAGTAEVLAVMERAVRWVAPRLMTVEVASALRQKVAGGELTAVQASSALDAILDAVADGVIGLANDEAFVLAAVHLALELGHRVPDCVYLAVAEREGAMLVSADRKLIALARRRGVEVIVVPPVIR